MCVLAIYQIHTAVDFIQTHLQDTSKIICRSQGKIMGLRIGWACVLENRLHGALPVGAWWRPSCSCLVRSLWGLSEARSVWQLVFLCLQSNFTLVVLGTNTWKQTYFGRYVCPMLVRMCVYVFICACVFVCMFMCVWRADGKLGCWSSLYTQRQGLSVICSCANQARWLWSGEIPSLDSHYLPGLLGLQTLDTISTFMWVLEIRTQIACAFYPLRPFPSPGKWHFNLLFMIYLFKT